MRETLKPGDFRRNLVINNYYRVISVTGVRCRVLNILSDYELEVAINSVLAVTLAISPLTEDEILLLRLRS